MTVKKLIIYIFSLFIITPVIGAESDEIKKVLIVNSYREDVTWANTLRQAIIRNIMTIPDVKIYSDHLNIESSPDISAIDLSTRSIIYSFQAEIEQEDLKDWHPSTIFEKSENLPDLIIFIGNEAWDYYRSYISVMKDWKSVPVLLSAVQDSSLIDRWLPGEELYLDNLTNTDRTYWTTKYNRNYRIRADLTGLDIDSKPDGSVNLSYDFNMTGVIVNDYVEENIELINSLLPERKDLIFIDYKYFTTAYINKQIRNNIDREKKAGYSYEFIYNTIENTDSIYNLMFRDKLSDNRVFITNSWSPNALNTNYTDTQLEAMLISNNTELLFSIKPSFSNNVFEAGGYHFSIEECSEKTSEIAIRILKGEEPRNIPFEIVEGSEIRLNQTAMQNFGILKKARNIGNVKFYNIPLSLLDKYENIILWILIIIVLTTGGLILILKNVNQIKKTRKESNKYRALSEELQLIYDNADINFTIYGKDGIPVLSHNVLNRDIMNDDLKERISSGADINEEIEYEGEAYQIIAHPVRKGSADDSKYITIVMDMTSVVRDRMEKERIESLLRHASDSFNVGIAYYNVTDNKGFANEAWFRNLGEQWSEDIGNIGFRNVTDADRDSILEYLNECKIKKQIEPFKKNIIVRGEDGNHWIRQYIYQVSFNQDSGSIQIAQLNLSVDQQKKSEVALFEAKQRAEQANRDTEEFLGNISHEMRTPLNAILGFSEILSTTNDHDTITELRGTILRNSVLLSQIINDVLELSRFDSDSVELWKSPVNLNATMHEMYTFLKESLNEKPAISAELSIPEAENNILFTDKYYLIRVLKHLISNAVKFTEKGKITIGYTKQQDRYYFFIEDTGIGIDLDQIDCIFKRFEKIDKFSQGSGLGLPLCRSIITHMGGEMGIISQPIYEKGYTSTTKAWFILS